MGWKYSKCNSIFHWKWRRKKKVDSLLPDSLQLLQIQPYSMCSVYKSATFAIIFSPIRLNLNSIILQDMKLDTFAQKLRYLRLERNLNQHEFANLLNKSFTSVCYWEQGNRIPKTETIKEIAEVLNVDYTYFKDQE